MAASLSRMVRLPLDGRACLRDSPRGSNALPSVLAFRGPSGSSIADSIGVHFQHRLLSAEPSEMQQQNWEPLPPPRLSGDTSAGTDNRRESQSQQVFRIDSSAPCTNSVRELSTTAGADSLQEGSQRSSQKIDTFETIEDDSGARGDCLAVSKPLVLKIPVKDGGTAALPSVRWNPWSVSPGKRRRIVKTESNVQRMRRKRPEPECSICEGSGKVECDRCCGRGRLNHTNLAMLPKGEWPQWCWSCRGSGLAFCNRCLGTGEKRGLIGFRMPEPGDPDF